MTRPENCGRDSLLADEERRQRPGDVALGLVVEPLPRGRIGLEADRVRDPVLLLPELVELLRRHELDLRELGLVGDRPDVALGGEFEERRHGRN
jgi:hypothetical protein